METINFDQNPVDEYSDDKAFHNVLTAKPTCFIIIGKPGVGKTTLALRLAKTWKCIFVNSTQTLEEAIKEETTLGLKAKQLLLNGDSVPEELAMAILLNKLESPEVQHHGYVLDDFPSASNEWMSPAKQIQAIQSWPLKPDFIINLKIPDQDLYERRLNLKVDPITNEIFVKEIYDPQRLIDDSLDNEEGSIEEEEEELDEEESTMSGALIEEDIFSAIGELTEEIVERLVRRPEDFSPRILHSIKYYKEILLRPLEDYMADHDRQYLIELDGKLAPIELFKALIAKLSTFELRPVIVPTRLQNDEDEIPQEDIDNDDLMRTMGVINMLAPRFRWRRSRWGRVCPVSLRLGNIVLGKPEFGVSFLGQMFFMSSQEALDAFMKNPRPYLLSPLPKIPCKLSVLGPPGSGKTTLSNTIASKLNAKVFSAEDLVKPHLQTVKDNLYNQAKEEALANAISVVKSNQQFEAERASQKGRRLSSKSASNASDDEGNDEEIDEAVEDEAIDEEEVGPEHPEVIALVNSTMENFNTDSIRVTPEMYVDAIEDAMIERSTELQESPDSNGQIYGSWILDNFPRTRDEWSLMADRGLIPDDIIFIDDSGDQSVLPKRWFTKNRHIIVERVRDECEKKKVVEKARREKSRREREVITKRLLEINEKRKELQAKQDGDTQDGDKDSKDGGAESTDRDPKEYQKEEDDDDDDDDEAKAKSDLAKAQEEALFDEEIRLKASLSRMGELGDDEEFEKSLMSALDKIPEEGMMPPECPEWHAEVTTRQFFDRDWSHVLPSIKGLGIEPIHVTCELNIEEQTEEFIKQVEYQFEHQPWEYTGIDLDEEEEDFEDEDDDPTIPGGGRKNFGETRHFCPVTLKERRILHPGTPEAAVRYREQTYFFVSTDARAQFLENPDMFLSDGKPLQPPPLRICVIGPRGSGKTFYGRTLSKQLGIFHIVFRERLQELIISKMQKRIMDELEEELQDDVSEHDNEEQNDEGSVNAEDRPNMESNNARGGIIEEEGEEEEDELELDEDEDAIRAYLADDEPIPDETLDKVIQPWWDEDPFRNKGFILEGFPRTANQVRYMAQAGFYPDIIIILNVDDADVMDRLLPPLMEKWQNKRNKRIEKREKEKERLRKLKEEEYQQRREEKLAEIAERKREREAERLARQAEREERMQRKREDGDSDISESEDEDEEDEEDEEDVDAILEEELGEEEEEEEDEEEAEDDARDRLKAVLLERYDDDMNRLSLVQETMEEVWMPKAEVNAGRKPHIVHYLLNKLMKPYTENRISLLEKCHPIDFRLSRQIIETGYKQSSRFGWWCPVKLFDKEVVQPLHGPGVLTYPVVHRSHVYYLCSEDARQRFIENPLKYIYQLPPGPVIPFQIAIVGPPKSGKTTLANRFVEDYGVLRLSMGEAIRLVLEKQSMSALAKEINEYLYIGQTVPDALAIQALENALLNVTCQTRGYVLDGFPCTKKQVELMNERKILPVKIIELDVEDKELKRRAAMDRRSKDRILPLHDSSRISGIKLKYWRKVVIPVKQWYEKRHFNWYTINGQASKWLVWNTASDIAKKSIQQIQTYTERISKGLAAPISNLCITPDECDARLGEYRHYCPVSLVNRGELRDCFNDNQLIYGAEFRGRYYKMVDENELQEFLNNPEQFIAPQSPVSLPSPHLLPIKRTPAEVKAKFPIEIELQGYCPVTYLEGKKRYESIIPGKPELLAEFDGKTYSFESEDKLEMFMRYPNKYHGLTLPKKLPPRLDPVNVTNLPILGYLEQSLAEITVKSLTAVGSFKPKHPFLDAHQSAHIYMAYFLKANNPRNNEYIRKKYRDKLRKFEDNCELITYLSERMSAQYKEPKERPIDFDHKMQNFLSMKEEVM